MLELLEVRLPGAPGVLDAGELLAEPVQEERLDDLEDVRFGRVVRPLGAAFRRVHDGLEERTENRRGNVLPVEPAGRKQLLPHDSVEGGNPDRVCEQVTVHVREPGKIPVERGGARPLGGVEHLKELGEERPEVGSVLAGPVLDEVEQEVALVEDPSIVGEQTEHDPHQEPFQFVPRVAAVAQRIVELAHQFRGLRCSPGPGRGDSAPFPA